MVVSPDATRTLPFNNSVAVCSLRGVSILAAGDHVLLVTLSSRVPEMGPKDAVIVADPSAIPVTRPSLTVAIDESEIFHVTLVVMFEVRVQIRPRCGELPLNSDAGGKGIRRNRYRYQCRWTDIKYRSA